MRPTGSVPAPDRFGSGYLLVRVLRRGGRETVSPTRHSPPQNQAGQSIQPTCRVPDGTIPAPSGDAHTFHARENCCCTVSKIGGIAAGKVTPRTRDHCREPRGLLRVEGRGRLPKVVARRSLRPKYPVAPFDDVQVDFEDSRLAQLGLEPAGNDQLPQLPEGVLGRREVEVLGQLLRDGAGAALGAGPAGFPCIFA